jgi:hypothetical protein
MPPGTGAALEASPHARLKAGAAGTGLADDAAGESHAHLPASSRSAASSGTRVLSRRREASPTRV